MERRRKKMTCTRCGEAHTNDNLNLYMDPANNMAVAERVCVFCEYGIAECTPNGTMGHKPGEPTPKVTREQDRLEAEADLVDDL